MQKNKQQLEEKLKHYESKIKNHFNSGGTTDKGRRNANYNWAINLLYIYDLSNFPLFTLQTAIRKVWLCFLSNPLLGNLKCNLLQQLLHRSRCPSHRHPGGYQGLNRSKCNQILTFFISSNVVFINELLLLSNHVLQILDRPGLQLQVEQQLHILRF